MDLVKHVLQRAELDVRQVASIMEDIERESKLLQEEKEPAPRLKKQFTLLVSDPDGLLPDQDLVGWVAQIPEDDSPATTVDRIVKAAWDFNQTPKGRRMPVQTIGEACEVVPARIFKEYDVWIKSKEPLLVVRTNNAVPTDNSE
jgi:hypothetical protein